MAVPVKPNPGGPYTRETYPYNPATPQLFTGWLRAMEDDAETIYGITPWAMNNADFKSYLAQMVAGLTTEVGEFSNELPWKRWKDGIYSDPKKVAGEAVDLLHFVAHCLNAVGVTEDELNEAYADKRKENRRRQDEGYSYASK